MTLKDKILRLEKYLNMTEDVIVKNIKKIPHSYMYDVITEGELYENQIIHKSDLEM